jgi:hypothetical protein
MNKLVFAMTLFLMVPALQAQQAATKDNPPQAEAQAAPQPAAQNSNAQDNLPAAIRPGHPLDPADVDILTGKRDHEIEASRRAAAPVMVGSSGSYGDYYWMNGRLGTGWEVPVLPLTRISNPFFFSGLLAPHGLGRGFGRGGFRRGR